MEGFTKPKDDKLANDLVVGRIDSNKKVTINHVPVLDLDGISKSLLKPGDYVEVIFFHFFIFFSFSFSIIVIFSHSFIHPLTHEKWKINPK